MYKFNINKVGLYLVIICSCIDLTSPISTYGLQIFGLMIASGFLTHNKKHNKTTLNIAILATTIMFINTIIVYSTSRHTEILWLQYLRFTFWTLVGFATYTGIKDTKENNILNVASFMSTILVCSIFIQLISAYAFGKIIDFAVFTGGSPSRSGSLDLLYRPTGLLSEPSTYCGVITGLITIRLLIKKRLDPLALFSILSMILTLSVIGIIIGITIISIFAMDIKKFKQALTLTPFLITLVILSADHVNNRIDLFNTGGDGSNNVKSEVISELLTDTNKGLWGFGLVGKSESAPTHYEALYDLTTFGNIIAIFGIPLGLLIDLMLLYSIHCFKFSMKEKLLTMISIVKLSPPFFVFFPIYMAIIYKLSNDRKLKLK